VGQTGGCYYLSGAHTWHVEPYEASKGSAAKDDRRPESTTLVVPFEAGSSTVRDDETEHSTQTSGIFLVNKIAGCQLWVLTLSAMWTEWRGCGRIWKSQ
jgi:hypothetical protein